MGRDGDVHRPGRSERDEIAAAMRCRALVSGLWDVARSKSLWQGTEKETHGRGLEMGEEDLGVKRARGTIRRHAGGLGVRKDNIAADRLYRSIGFKELDGEEAESGNSTVWLIHPSL